MRQAATDGQVAGPPAGGDPASSASPASADHPATTPAPVLLDAAVTTRCRRRVHLEHDPGADAGGAREDDDPGVAMRRADAAAHRADAAARWAAVLGDELVSVPPGERSRERVRRTLAAIEAGARYVSGAELPAAAGRRGGAELLVRDAGGWRPLIVVRHRITDPGEGALTSPIDRPHPAAAVADPARRVRTVTRDVLRLAHLHRMLGEAGLAPPDGAGPVLGGVVGLDADVVVWVDLAGGEDAPGGQDGAGGPPGSGGSAGARSTLATYDRRHADRLAVAEAARAGGPALAEATRITECRRCPWWPTCEGALRARDDVSLVVRGETALRLRGLGIATVRELAAVDPVAGPPAVADPDADPDAATEGGAAAGFGPGAGTEGGAAAGFGPGELAEAVALARAWRADVPLVRRVRRPAVARGDVEVDVDMESLGEDGAYLWGTLLSGADIGLAPGYRGFATWDPLPTRDEGRSFGAFWAWLREVWARAAERGLSVRAYCYNEQAENRWLRASAERFAGMADVPAPAEVEEFIASPEWVDLFPAVSTSFLCPHGKGLKRVAPSAGFAWRDAEAGGENSMRWYRAAVALDGGEPDASQRERLLVYNEDDVRATHALRRWMTSDAVLEVPLLGEL